METTEKNMEHGEHFNESIVNEVILEDMKKNRIDHMKYLPGMEVLEESDVMDQVISAMNAYDYDKYTEADVRRALAHDNRTPEDFQALLSPAALPLLEEIAQAAQKETRKHFGNSVYMFTPIYIANYCENYCIYCGFNCHNKIRRAKLNAEEIDKEMAAIAKTGLQEILILTGESRAKSDVKYIGEACKIARKYFKVIGLEVYPMNSDEYAYLHECGADYVTVFQETYNSDKYETLHLAGHKRIFPYRLNAQERALKGGMRGVGFAALLGLDDFRKDAFATGYHAYLLQRKYPHAEIAFSCPRLRPIINNDRINPMDVHEPQLNAEEIDKEMAAIAKTGLQEILILTGESRAKSDVKYIGEACKIARKYFKVIGLEVYPMNSDEYAYLHECGADYVTVFQETYNSDKYETLHLAGHKRIFPYRLNAQERALKGGMRGVGFAALLGLDDFRKDAFATGYHAYLLQRKYPHAEIAFSCPRLRPIINNDRINPMDVHEPQLLQVVCAYRLFMPFASITVSTRECERVRDNLVGIAATKISAGVSTGIGSHVEDIEDKGDDQFEISDGRSVDEVYKALLDHDLQPVMNDYVYL